MIKWLIRLFAKYIAQEMEVIKKAELKAISDANYKQEMNRMKEKWLAENNYLLTREKAIMRLEGVEELKDDEVISRVKEKLKKFDVNYINRLDLFYYHEPELYDLVKKANSTMASKDYAAVNYYIQNKLARAPQ